MSTFIDRYGREISILADDHDAIAKHEGRKIGEVTTTGLREMDEHMPDWPAEITGMFVDQAYQKAGIGLELIRQLSDELGALAPAQKNMGRGGENALTDEGFALTVRAQKKGYVLPFDEDEG